MADGNLKLRYFFYFSGHRARGRADGGFQCGWRRARSRPSTEHRFNSGRLSATPPASRHVQSAYPVESCKYTWVLPQYSRRGVLTAFPQTMSVNRYRASVILSDTKRTEKASKIHSTWSYWRLFATRPFTRDFWRIEWPHKERHYRYFMAWYAT